MAELEVVIFLDDELRAACLRTPEFAASIPLVIPTFVSLLYVCALFAPFHSNDGLLAPDDSCDADIDTQSPPAPTTGYPMRRLSTSLLATQRLRMPPREDSERSKSYHKKERYRRAARKVKPSLRSSPRSRFRLRVLDPSIQTLDRRHSSLLRQIIHKAPHRLSRHPLAHPPLCKHATVPQPRRKIPAQPPAAALLSTQCGQLLARFGSLFQRYTPPSKPNSQPRQRPRRRGHVPKGKSPARNRSQLTSPSQRRYRDVGVSDTGSLLDATADSTWSWVSAVSADLLQTTQASALMRHICSHPQLILHRPSSTDPLIAAYAFGSLSISRPPLIVFHIGRLSAHCSTSQLRTTASSPITTHCEDDKN
ncbi:hypothetical protein R3P38DRAFT_3181862 [Favolaschia claudopus]|uniref:Uncharacterized protein n=1 Tax=Favolaschia claudopus TaxID=2862362 RepID=A0AAW0CMF0_9AGAR